jgi:hypothetical protein
MLANTRRGGDLAGRIEFTGVLPAIAKRQRQRLNPLSAGNRQRRGTLQTPRKQDVGR